MADLADTWDVSPDGLTWTFHLHPGVKWHDGQPFTANDVAFTISRALLNTAQEPTERLVRRRRRRQGRPTRRPRSPPASRSSTTTRSRSTIGAPNARLRQRPDRLRRRSSCRSTSSRTPIRPSVETIAFATTSPIGTGPYKFIKYETDQYSQFEANPDYFKGAPKIKNIFVKRLTGDQAIAQLAVGRSRPVDPAQPGRAGPPREGPDPRRALDARRRDVRPVHEPAVR